MNRNDEAQHFQPHDTPQQQQGIHPLANYQFSPEELRAIKQCDVESLQRSIPIGTGLALAAYYGVKGGYLKGNVKYGPTPKVVFAAVVGYFLGKFSYQNKCAEKIMAIPGSKLGEMLRMRRKGGLYENLTPDQGFGAGFALSPFQSATEKYSDEIHRVPGEILVYFTGSEGCAIFTGGEFSWVQTCRKLDCTFRTSIRSTSLNLDTERPSMSGLDDTYRPNIDGTPSAFEDVALPLSPPKSQTSYDELRIKNREEYAKKNQNPFYRPLQQQESTPVVRPSERQPDETPTAPKGSANKYGDVWAQ